VAVTAQRLVELSCPICKGECSPFCQTFGRGKRASVFELLSGKNLNAVLKEAKGELASVNYRTLKDVIKKGIALGYIKEGEYERWVSDTDG
jgi:competence protein ComGA